MLSEDCANTYLISLYPLTFSDVINMETVMILWDSTIVKFLKGRNRPNTFLPFALKHLEEPTK